MNVRMTLVAVVLAGVALITATTDAQACGRRHKSSCAPSCAARLHQLWPMCAPAPVATCAPVCAASYVPVCATSCAPSCGKVKHKGHRHGGRRSRGC